MIDNVTVSPVGRGRRSVRLPGFDYGCAGSYFVTICAFERRHLFGSIGDGVIVASPVGQIILEEWARSASLRPEWEIDAFVLMPNHLHGVIRVQKPSAPGDPGRPSKQARTLSSFVSGFKAAVTSIVRRQGLLTVLPVWQRSFFEHVVRNERELSLIRRYIRANPVMWRRDSELRAW